MTDHNGLCMYLLVNSGENGVVGGIIYSFHLNLCNVSLCIHTSFIPDWGPSGARHFFLWGGELLAVS